MIDFISSRAPAHAFVAGPYRILLGVLATLVAGFGVWVAATEWLRPTSAAVATSIERSVGADEVGRARLAARIGLVRGDLWADYAALMGAVRPQPGKTPLREEAWTAAHRAASLGPLDLRPWLLLAERAMDSGDPATLVGMLNMSFLTGPNAVAVIPQRLSLVARTPARTDPDIRSLVRHDLRLLAQQPDGVSRLRAVWRQTDAEGRDFLSGMLQEVDARLLQEVQKRR